MVIVYQYELPQASIVQEDSKVTITFIPTAVYALNPKEPDALFVLGAAYGLGEMTSKFQSLVVNNKLSFTANYRTFFETLPGETKSMVVVNRLAMVLLKQKSPKKTLK